jgi:hypothetical protein
MARAMVMFKSDRDCLLCHSSPVSGYGFTLNGFTVNGLNSYWNPEEEEYVWFPIRACLVLDTGSGMTKGVKVFIFRGAYVIGMKPTN